MNLVQGDYDQETVFSEDPVDQALQWHKLGGSLIHIVDLDGAKEGRCCIEPQLRQLSSEGVPFEVGGGIRTIETIDQLFALGAERVILGTAAHEDPELLSAAIAKYPNGIVVGIDAKAGKVALSAWLDVRDTDAIEFAQRVVEQGASRVIYTDILSDGGMKGPNLDTTRAMAEAITAPVTASGGMSTLEDIERVAKLSDAGVDEVIIGRALYLDVFSLPEALAVAEGSVGA